MSDEVGVVYGLTSQSQPGDTPPVSSGYDDHVVIQSGVFDIGVFESQGIVLLERKTYYMRGYTLVGGEYSYDSDETVFETQSNPDTIIISNVEDSNTERIIRPGIRTRLIQ